MSGPVCTCGGEMVVVLENDETERWICSSCGKRGMEVNRSGATCLAVFAYSVLFFVLIIAGYALQAWWVAQVAR